MAHNGYRYDDNLVLRVSPPLWLVIFWTTHHILLIIFASLSKSGDVFGMVMEYASSKPLLASDIPGALVLMASVKRTPEAGSAIRWIWNHGKWLLALSLSISMAVTIYLHMEDIAAIEKPTPWVLVINTLFGFYVMKSRWVKDIFSDFPQPATQVQKSDTVENKPS